MLTGKQMIDIQKEYFEIVTENFGPLIDAFESTNSIEKAIEVFKQQTPSLIVPGYSDNQLYRMKKTRENLVRFWKRYMEPCREFIVSSENVGFFGAYDNVEVSHYMNALKRNSLFYSILVFDDPFFVGCYSEKEWKFDSNAEIYYRNVLNIRMMNQYISDKECQPFAVFFPFLSLFSDNEKHSIVQGTVRSAKKWISDVFNLSMEEPDYEDDIKKLKEYPADEIEFALIENGFDKSYLGGLNYHMQLLSEDQRRCNEELCRSIFGSVDREGIRAILSYEVLPNIAGINCTCYSFDMHISNLLGINPILSRKEWMPLKRDMQGKMLPATDDYLFGAAVHRNDRMAELVSLDDEELLLLHSSENCSRFRKLFHEANQEIRVPYSNIEEISEEVFAKTDEILEKEVNEYFKKSRAAKGKSIFGLIKCAASYVPILSYVVNVIDSFGAAKDFVTTMRDKDTFIEHFKN